MRAVHWSEGGLKVDSRRLTLVCFTFKTSMRAVHWSEGGLKGDSRHLTLFYLFACVVWTSLSCFHNNFMFNSCVAGESLTCLPMWCGSRVCLVTTLVTTTWTLSLSESRRRESTVPLSMRVWKEWLRVSRLWHETTPYASPSLPSTMPCDTTVKKWLLFTRPTSCECMFQVLVPRSRLLVPQLSGSCPTIVECMIRNLCIYW